MNKIKIFINILKTYNVYNIFMLIYELEDLKDILDLLVFEDEDEPTIFTEDIVLELLETSFQLMEEYINDNMNILSDPYFKEILLEEMKELFYTQFEEDILNSDFIEDELNDILEDIFNIFINTFYPDKILENNDIELNDITTEDIDIIENKIQKLRDTPQPDQRTLAWYLFRWNLITASNAWKAFESQSTMNQLIYEKCQPLKTNLECEEEQNKTVNINSPLHWGQKYEPLSVLLYETKYDTKVEDFGCIQHPKYNFIGASPDGIITDKTSQRFGRMLEIKNVVSREITGIPKKEYWVQMQLQMEVCDLDECDFLETKFIEYSDTEAFYNDSLVDETGDTNLTISLNGKTKGIIIYFQTKENKPFYVYKPLNIVNNNDIKYWEETELEKYEAEPYNFVFIKFIYWKLEVLSCVNVLRNREWFEKNIDQLEKVWNIILEERVSGYQHRAPIKKQKKEPMPPQISNNELNGCLLKFNKIIKLDTDNN